MKAAAMSVWVFINLLCFGMCGYLYLIWSQYWMYIEKQRLFNKSPENKHNLETLWNSDAGFVSEKYHFKSPFNLTLIDSFRKIRRSAVGSYWSGGILQTSSKSSQTRAPLSTNVIRKSNGSPRFPNIHKPILEFDTDKYVCDDLTTLDCDKRTKQFKELVLKEFHRVLMGDSKVFRSGLDSQNPYNVKYEAGNRRELSKKDIMCSLKRVKVKTVLASDEPFARLGFNIPRESLQGEQLYDTCAVVTSAGALLGSRLGEFIDSHDMVLRFNNAPTENYTDDVGTKTTFRVLNSQVIAKPEYKFLEDSLYKNISILIWDPANFTSTLEQWYYHPDHQIFPVYKTLLARRPTADVHLLNPQVLWSLWALLQDSSPYRLRKNPPSSGFIGVWFALHRCNHVRVFEYVPSVRVSRRCHYYTTVTDSACTLGAWHPLAREKALTEIIRNNSDIDVFQRGFIDIRGILVITIIGIYASFINSNKVILGIDALII